MFEKRARQGKGGYLGANRFGQPVEQDTVVAVGALLCEMAKADDDFAAVERREIARLLEKNWQLTSEHAEDVVETSSFLLRHEIEPATFIDVVNQEYTEAQRKRVLSMLWSVALADGKVKASEVLFVGEITQRLEI